MKRRDSKTGRMVRVYPITYKNCLNCSAEFKARRRINRKGDVYWSNFCSQKCSHAFQVRDRHSCWKRGHHVAHGYYVDSFNGNYQHRNIIENIFGRKLSSSEHVHHLNGVKTDNRLENLKVMSPSEHAYTHWEERRIMNNLCRWCNKGPSSCTCKK